MKSFVRFAWILSAAAVCGTARGQDVETGGGLDDILVTARKFEERLQDAPVSVAAYTEQDLEERSVDSVRDIVAYTPNVSAPIGYNGGSDGFYYIRGVGQNDFSTAFDPAVGTYIDGVYLGRTSGAMFELMDIERIEVLRGPQGTLFGRNTIGGALNVITQKPTGNFGIDAAAVVGERSRLEGRVSLDLPVVPEVLAAKLSLLAKNQDGYGRSLVYGEDLGDVDTVGGRLVLDWTLTEYLGVQVSADFSNNDGTPWPQTTPGHNVGIDPAILPFMLPLPADINDDISPDHLTTWSSVAPINESDVWGVSATVTWDLRSVSLKSITAYRELEQTSTADYDATRYVFYDNTVPIDQDQVSQELQLSGLSFDDRLKWLGGVYYYQEDVDQTNGITLGASGPLGHTGFTAPYTDVFGRFYPSGIPTYDPLTFANIGDLRRIVNRQRILLDVDSWALFGQATFSVTEKLSVTFGGRYTDENKEQQYLFVQDNTIPDLQIPVDPFGLDPLVPDYIPRAVGLTTALDTVVEESWDSFDARAGGEYRFTDDLMAYFVYSEGFRSGGFNSRPVLAGITPFDPEELSTYEIGVKSEWWENRLRANVAFFYSDYEDIQLGVIEGGFFNVRNAGSAELKGFELEVTAAPISGLNLNLGVGYIDDEIKEVDASAMIAGILEGNELPFTPEWTFNLGAQYTLPLRSGLGSLSLRGDYNYADEQYSFANNWEGNLLDSRGVVNFRAWWTSPGEQWEVAAYGTNVFDEEYMNFAEDVRPVLGTISQWWAAPSEWGLELTYHY